MLVGLKGARLLPSSWSLMLVLLLVLVSLVVLCSGCLVVFGRDGGGDGGGVNVFNLVDIDAISSVILEVEVMGDSFFIAVIGVDMMHDGVCDLRSGSNVDYNLFLFLRDCMFYYDRVATCCYDTQTNTNPTN